MKKLLLLAALVALASCQLLDINVGNGVSVNTEINAGEFDSISSQCSLDIIYTQKEGEPRLTLTCDENLVEYYTIEVEDGTLVVDVKWGTSVRPKVKSYLTINSPKLNGISVSGSGKCQVTSPVACNGDFSLKVSGSGSIHAEGMVDCQNFSSSISGSGKINASGVLADDATFRCSGSGSTHIDYLTADSISAKISGSGGIYLVCKDAGDIDVSISGSGSVHLSGNARSLKSNTSGSGRVDSKDLNVGL